MSTLVLDPENYIAGFSKTLAKKVLSKAISQVVVQASRPEDDRFDDSMASEITISYDADVFMTSGRQIEIPTTGLSKLPTLKECVEDEGVEEFDKETLAGGLLASKEQTPRKAMIKSSSEKGHLTITDDASISNFMDDDDLSYAESRRATEALPDFSNTDDVNHDSLSYCLENLREVSQEGLAL